jgi:hypothetical protein
MFPHFLLIVRDYYFFGSGPHGQLALGKEEIVAMPTKTLAPTGGKLVVGSNHCCHISGMTVVVC